MAQLELRKYPRFETKIDAHVLTPDSNISAIVTDISKEGFCLSTEEPVSPNTVIAISLNLDEKIMLQGITRWILKFETGIRFKFLVGAEIKVILYPNIKNMGYLDKHSLFDEIFLTITEYGGIIREKEWPIG